MAKYRIYTSVDGENYFWIVVDNGMIVRNPIKEDLEGTKLKTYNQTNICPRCREDMKIDGKELTDKSILYPGNARIYVNKEGKRTEIWVCNRHWGRDYQKYECNSQWNIIKSLGDRRTGNLRSDSEQQKGDNGEELLCIWKGYTNLNRENDNYESPIDCVDKNTGLHYQAKIAHYNPRGGRYELSSLEREWYKRYEAMFCFCISKDGRIIERVYIIPWTEIIKRKGISVYKNPTKGILWYEKYRLKDEEELKNVNKIWNKIICERSNSSKR